MVERGELGGGGEALRDRRALTATSRVARAGWGEAQGWNKASRAVTGTQRIPIAGLSQGHKTKNPSKHTDEFAGDTDSGRAIVVVPDGTDFWGGKLEVLLLFHGMGESVGIGYRERTTEDKEGAGGIGTVHDVEADLIPQQLASSGRNMIAILVEERLAIVIQLSAAMVYGSLNFAG